MATGGISGRYGDVKIGLAQVCDVQKWSFNPKIQINSYASNCTNQAKVKVPGVKDATGSLEGVYNPAEPIMATLDVGTIVTLKLYITSTVFYQVPAIISSLKVDVDIDSGDFVKWTADFEANGAWTNPVAAQFAPPTGDETTPDPVETRTRRTPASRPALDEERIAELVHGHVALATTSLAQEVLAAAAEVAASAAVAAVQKFLESRSGQPASQAA